MTKKLKIGADAWLNDSPGYRKGTKQYKLAKKRRPKQIKLHKKERAAHGYSSQDWWNFDDFIAGVVATAVLRFAESGAGYFAIHTGTAEGPLIDTHVRGLRDPEASSADHQADFVAACGAIYFALTEWLTHDDSDWAAQEVRYAEAREAMVLFAEHFGHWWD